MSATTPGIESAGPVGRRAAAAVLAAVALGACGSTGSTASTRSTASKSGGSGGSGTRSSRLAAQYAKRTPTEIFADLKAALSSAHSFSAAGQVDVSGQPAAVTVAVQQPSSVAFSRFRRGDLIKLTVVPPKNYIYANAVFWKQHAPQLSAAQLAPFANRWFTAPASVAVGAASILSELSPRHISQCLLGSAPSPTVVGASAVDGSPAVELHFRGGLPGTAPGNLWVSAAAPHLPLRLQTTGPSIPGGTGICHVSAGSGSGPEELTLSRWNATRVVAPSGATALP